MALDKRNLVQLAKTVAKADRSTPTAYSFNGESFDYDTLQETLRKELNEIAGTYQLYRENKNLIFSVIEEVIDDILPKRVEIAYEQFAEVKQFAQGDKPLFRRKLRNTAKAISASSFGIPSDTYIFPPRLWAYGIASPLSFPNTSFHRESSTTITS